WEGWVISLRQKQKKLIMLPSETMIWQPEFTDKTLSRKTGAVHNDDFDDPFNQVSAISHSFFLKQGMQPFRLALTSPQN
ncbi:hypothetical protein RRF83_20645, partial [Escherichia coli]|uniref:hypothetical protein n=1 Tax=Escherichia coli TaxID=562 RepID=UPI0028DA7167